MMGGCNAGNKKEACWKTSKTKTMARGEEHGFYVLPVATGKLKQH